MNATSTSRYFIQRWRAFGYALGIARIGLILMIAAVALLLSAQGRDILVNLAERGMFASQIFFLAVFYWAVSIWYWSRALLNVRFPDPPAAMDTFNFWRKHLPRWLGAMAFLAVGSALAITWLDAPPSVQTGLLVLMLSALAWGGLFLLVVIYRRKVARWLRSRIAAPEGVPGIRRLMAQSLDVGELNTDARDTRRAQHLLASMMEFAPSFGVGSALFGAVLFFWAWISPITLGTLFGAVVLFMLWGGSWMPIGSAATWFGDRFGIPVLTLLVIAAFAFSLTNDNHEIRKIDGGGDPAQRQTVADAVKAWRRTRAESSPFVLVATAGGGIRASYWTATVLGQLHDCIPDFEDHLFGVSGVSGGSVGATVYRSVVAGHSAAPSCEDRETGAALTGARACAQEVLEGDFLGPAVAALLYPDTLQRFLPGVWLPDRAEALEESWEAAYRDVMGKDLLSQSLVDLDELDGRAWPALFLNATWSETGRRIVASNLNLEPSSFPLLVDQLSELGRDLRLSTAAHNSARFTAVSPPGMWENAGGKTAGHLVDGGYFENYGAETALAVLKAARAVEAEEAEEADINPLLILISSDPGLPKNLTDVRAAEPISFGYEVRGILSALLNTRNARGVEAATQLNDTASRGGRAFAYFRMCEEDRQTEPPLGWTLSEAARKSINDYLPPPGSGAARCDNGASLKKVLAAFGRNECVSP